MKVIVSASMSGYSTHNKKNVSAENWFKVKDLVKSNKKMTEMADKARKK